MRQKIIEQLNAEMSRKNIDIVTDFVLKNTEYIALLIDLTFSDNKNLSLRAAWTLDKISEKNSSLLSSYSSLMVKKLPEICNTGTLREVTKILIYQDIGEEHESFIIDYCISVIESVKYPVAVKANCISLIFKLLPKYSSLKNEITEIIESQIPHNSAGFRRRYKLLRNRYNLI
jgi:hypothetical protein